MNNMTTMRMLLSTAVLAAVAAVLAGGANAMLMDVEGGSGGEAQFATPLHAALANRAATPAAVDNTLDPAIRTAIAARESDRNVQQALAEKGPIPYFSHGATAVTPQPDPLAEKGPIPYFSHGIGADRSLWGGQVSLGLTGDSPITRVVGQEPAGLTGDSPRTRGQVFQANATFASSSDSDVNWTWVGFGAGMAALLAAAMGALYLSARHRDRVALP